jgi:hypothetical protein
LDFFKNKIEIVGGAKVNLKKKLKKEIGGPPVWLAPKLKGSSTPCVVYISALTLL